MSVKATARVVDRSRAKGGALQALVSIADHADDDGRHAFPSPATIAWKWRQTRRWAEGIIEKLVVDGEVFPRWDAKAKRLYLDIRCICDWEAYQQEGQIPTRDEPERARTIRANFARKLEAIAVTRRDKKLTSDDSDLSRHDTLREAQPVEISASASPGETSPSQPSGTIKDPSEEPSERDARDGRAVPRTPDRMPEAAMVQEFVSSWNVEAALAGLPPCTGLSRKRRRLIRACLVERPLAAWREVFARVAASDWLAGRTDRRAAPATLDWLIADGTNALKVLEGQYDNRKSTAQSPGWRPSSAPGCPHDPPCPAGTPRFRCHQRDVLGDKAVAAYRQEAS